MYLLKLLQKNAAGRRHLLHFDAVEAASGQSDFGRRHVGATIPPINQLCAVDPQTDAIVCIRVKRVRFCRRHTHAPRPPHADVVHSARRDAAAAPIKVDLRVNAFKHWRVEEPYVLKVPAKERRLIHKIGVVVGGGGGCTAQIDPQPWPARPQSASRPTTWSCKRLRAHR